MYKFDVFSGRFVVMCHDYGGACLEECQPMTATNLHFFGMRRVFMQVVDSILLYSVEHVGLRLCQRQRHTARASALAETVVPELIEFLTKANP